MPFIFVAQIMIKIHDKEFRPYLSSEEIQKRVKELAEALHREFLGKTPIFVSILNGSFVFASDLIKNYKGECKVAFTRLSSYEGMASTECVKQLVGLELDVENQDVVVLEDIVDTGNTLQEIYNIFNQKKVKNLKIVSLFFKPEAYKKDLPIHHIGFSIPNLFIVGYGLDYDELGRNLPEVYQLNI